jgi:hypothetical protein
MDYACMCDSVSSWRPCWARFSERSGRVEYFNRLGSHSRQSSLLSSDSHGSTPPVSWFACHSPRFDFECTLEVL